LAFISTFPLYLHTTATQLSETSTALTSTLFGVQTGRFVVCPHVEALEVLRELRGIAKEDRLIKCVHTTTSHYYYEMALPKRNNNDPFRSSQSAHLLSSLQVTLFGPDTLVLITFRLAGKPTGVFILGPESTHPMPYDSIRRSLPFSKLGERASYIGLP
jgi:hypothetical protein